MRKKVKEKVMPLSSATAEDNGMKAMTVVASDPEDKDLRIKQQIC